MGVESLILVGGGLANGLIAYFLRKSGSPLRPLIIERESCLGGNHTWSFHHHDVSAEARGALKPLLRASWPHQGVAFPSGNRRLETPYYAMTSADLHEALMRDMGDRVILDAEVREVGPQYVVLEDGRVMFAKAVVDGRGPARSVPLTIPVGYQKFFGQDVVLDEPHGLDGPVIMDATVSQVDGYRFFYLLPWTETSLLIEDTYYSNSPRLSPVALRDGIRRYAERRGWRIENVFREEHGVLPIPLGGELESIWPNDSRTPRAGVTAGLFHPTTGYSFPESVAAAECVARMDDLDASELLVLLRERARVNWYRGRFFRFLNRMLFRAAEPAERIDVFERFYTLPETLVRRFYRGDLRFRDAARLLVGKPPVNVRRALECLRESVPETPAREMSRA